MPANLFREHDVFEPRIGWAPFVSPQAPRQGSPARHTPAGRFPKQDFRFTSFGPTQFSLSALLSLAVPRRVNLAGAPRTPPLPSKQSSSSSVIRGTPARLGCRRGVELICTDGTAHSDGMAVPSAKRLISTNPEAVPFALGKPSLRCSSFPISDFAQT